MENTVQTLTLAEVEALPVGAVETLSSGGSTYPVSEDLPVSEYIAALLNGDTAGVVFTLDGTTLTITQASAGTKG